MKNNIFLIDFMGAGKSAVARALSHNCHMDLIEMNEQIETEQRKKISEIFAEEGEEYFRNLETQLLIRLQQQENVVVSCGGSIVTVHSVHSNALRDAQKLCYCSLCSHQHATRCTEIVLLLTLFASTRYAMHRNCTFSTISRMLAQFRA